MWRKSVFINSFQDLWLNSLPHFKVLYEEDTEPQTAPDGLASALHRRSSAVGVYEHRGMRGILQWFG